MTSISLTLCFRKSAILPLDLDKGDVVEHALILNLQAKGFAFASAVWGKIVTDCVYHAKARHTLKIAHAEAQYMEPFA